ncbi:heme lyase CcmF/NrfE family subunit [Psychrobium sp. 1_MG-2023]|uniref:heme lyase CcmF/NrfE family subunit n=1 Tax=Psychrobium sp. 1_MG-2023 TaxID=3062624 RepID=UPI000C335ED5|nr:heme lyase CcmF/NrfE family subunit [Psychrobium sp. 1_MG-2023]MDP2562637.1 heme lyase CcmF/NrfE family subunit [Psychrobium sp. 1_MG-2023]PKF54392.1 heme lyase NrfEFG subunit NrfE [Alteromonadales bacterium alter-6D02]
MIPELGNFSLIVGLAFAVCLSIIPLVGVNRNNLTLVRYARPLTFGMFFFVALSYGLLTYSFIIDDFSIAYIVQQSNTHLPIQYKIAAVFGGHEGSLLFWILTLCIWAVALAMTSRNLDEAFVARVLAILGMIAAGFFFFTLLTSNPFNRIIFDIPVEGRDLNPLLQDIGLILHPPMLYLGYVGFSVAFAFAVAALMSGRMDAAWARWTRPWTLAAWAFLTGGIVLGSWWAYYELGWGGWWFWDPVENASFMPWLIGTALIHSLSVTEQRGQFRNWTVLLAISAFSLSLLGTFLVRSGVLNSVHSFAADPSRGMFILLLLAIAVIGSLTLFAFKASDLKAPSNFELFSRETLMLVGNVALVVATATVLLGTLYPLLVDALGMGKISVGPPFFNAVFNPIISAMVVVMAMAPIIRWKKNKSGTFVKELGLIAVVSVLFGLAFPVVYGGEFIGWVAIGMGLAFWLTAATLKNAKINITNAQGKVDVTKPTQSYWGMVVAHIGIAISIVGATLVSHYETQLDIRMDSGDTVSLSGYEFKLERVIDVEGPNYSAKQAHISAFEDGEQVALLKPERRVYLVQTMGMTEAGIDSTLMRDLFVALGDPLDNDAWAVRIYVKPFINLLWLAGALIMVGGFMCMTDRRYRSRKKAKASDKVDEAAVSGQPA